jgi:hypothetical protein
MTNNPDIINSKIVGAEWDVFWQETDAETTGAGTKEVLVLSLPFADGSTEAVQLTKILQACKLQTEGYAIIKLAAEKQLPWHKLREAFQPKAVLLFGIMPQQLGISAMFRLFTPNRFNDCVWVASPALAELEQQPEAKKQLWQLGLKPVFEDKTIGNL